MAKLLEVKNLVKKYREGAAESRAVDKVDLEVHEGEFIIVMGVSGSGKTSLLHLVAGIDTPDEGTYPLSANRGFWTYGRYGKDIV